jgi:hypothetical protein
MVRRGPRRFPGVIPGLFSRAETVGPDAARTIRQAVRPALGPLAVRHRLEPMSRFGILDMSQTGEMVDPGTARA